MKLKLKQYFSCLIALLAVISPGHTAFAGDDPSRASSPDDADAESPNVQPGSSPLIQLNHSTDYSSQYPPAASFMQSPYGRRAGSGSVMMQSPYGGAGYSNANPATASMLDPYGAQEISPYSRYSPYIEVVGEGSDYTLGIDDVITIIVRNQPDFSGRYVVDPEGNIQYNFVGDIPAVGKTKEELKQEIINRLKRFVRYPEVAVMISEYRSKAVYVFGYVNSPGKYAMKGNKISVKEAIVAAGLPRMDGSLKRVYVIRPSEYVEDGKPQKKKVDLKKLLEKGISAEDFVLQPGDTLIVHQRYFDKFVNNFTRLVGPIFQAAAVYELAWGESGHGFLNPNRNK
ncbi:MAG: polysaccharide export protein [Candidatus Omnitrophica bacterium]|nr:polysaccharide export protein [Candidatus Omnitrophota bacterium]